MSPPSVKRSIYGHRISYCELAAANHFTVHTHVPMFERLLKNYWNIHVSLRGRRVNSGRRATNDARNDVQLDVAYGDM